MRPTYWRQWIRVTKLSALAVALAASLLQAAKGRAQDATDPNLDVAKILETCRAIQDSDARLRCFESATSILGGSQRAPSTPGSLEGWRLVRTPRPAGGKDAVSIMHTADPLRSDPDLAGLVIRCSETGNEVLIALITPLPPRARPQVVLGDTGAGPRLEAKVLPPGALILLPPAATVLANGRWQALPELSVQVTDEGTAIRGVVPLQGLAAGLQVLTANCPAN
jgi:hypothetical protein